MLKFIKSYFRREISIGLVPMSAKPYHKGHHQLVQRAASQNQKVYLYVSTSDRVKKNEFPIYGKDMEFIWQNYLEDILPKNVNVIYGGSPVGKVYTQIREANNHKNKITYSIYSDAKDIEINYPEKNRIKYFGDLYHKGKIKFVGLTRGKDSVDVSGTQMRRLLSENDFNTFSKYLPDQVNAKNVWNRLKNEAKQI